MMAFFRTIPFAAALCLWGSLANSQMQTLADQLDLARKVEAMTQAGDPVVQVSSGTAHACALVQSRKVYCWGNRQVLVLTPQENRLVPERIKGLKNVIQIATGYQHACALKANGRVFCWGANYVGQLGDGSFDDSETPVRGKAAPNAVQISSGDDHTCILMKSGRVLCWGMNIFGELGFGVTGSAFSTPQRVATPTLFSKVSAGLEHTCAVGRDERAYC